MEQFFWLTIFAMVTVLATRWLVAWSTAPLGRQYVRNLLLQRLESIGRQVTYSSEDGEQILFRVGDTTCTVLLGQLYRRCAEFPHQTSDLVRQAALGIQHAIEDQEALPASWRERVMPYLWAADADMPPDIAMRAYIPDLHILFGIEGREYTRWLSHAEVTASGCTMDELYAIALTNLERSCNTLVIAAETLPQDERDRFIIFRTLDGLDASRLLLPSFYQRFSPRFGDTDLFVAIPNRDTLMLSSSMDRQGGELLRWRTRGDFRRQAYPLFDGLLLVTDRGVSRRPMPSM